MPEGVQTADGKPLGLDPAAAEDAERAFAQSMSAPGPDDKSAPPKRAARERVEDGPARVRSARAPRTPKAGKAEPAREQRPAPTRAEIVQGIGGLVQIGAGVALVASRRAKNPVPFKADAVTLASSAEDIGEACARTAEVDPKFAALMAKVCNAGPYAALMAVGFQVGGQLARNHGVPVPGTTDPAELVEAASKPAEPEPAPVPAAA